MTWTPSHHLGFASAALVLVLVAAPAHGQERKESILPGSRPTIEARRFSSLQAALDAVPERGGLVQLPAGKFEIKEPLILKRGETRLAGVGAATHIVNTNQEGKPALILQHPDGDQVKRSEHLWRVSLANFRMTGNPESGHGIVANRIEELFVQGVTVTHHGGDGIRLDHCYEDPRISDCLMTYNKGIGLHLIGCHDIVVAANQFEENQDALHCIDGFNLCMTGNCLDDHLGKGVVIENTYGSVLSGNMIEECKADAVLLDRNCYGITISANVIAHNGSGINLKDAHGCAVSANTLTIMKTNAVRIGPESGRITVTGNNFSDSYIGDNQVKRREGDRSAAGLVLDATRDLAITGNVFSGLRPKAVACQGEESEGIIFSDNRIVDSPSDLGRSE
ncbi:MAG: right-handed parallel beta-helix repeat-containing protein [Pirellulaceae bacterium]